METECGYNQTTYMKAEGLIQGGSCDEVTEDERRAGLLCLYLKFKTELGQN